MADPGQQPSFMKTRLICFLLLILALQGNIFSQDGEFKFSHLTTEAGLSGNVVNAILEDHYGFVWFATSSGLNRYDGRKIISFHHEDKDSNSLSSENILCMYEDADHILWLGTYDGGLNAYNRRTGSFTHFLHNTSDSTSISANNISAIIPLPSGELGLATSKGLDIFNPVTKKSRLQKMLDDDGLPLKHSGINDLFIDHEGMVWLSGNYPCMRLDLHSGRVSSYGRKRGFPAFDPSQQTYCITEDKQLNIWITSSVGLIKYIRKEDRCIYYRHSDNDPHSLCGNLCNSVYCDNSNRVWVTTNTGLSVYLPDKNYFISSINDPSDNNSLSNNYTSCVKETRNNIVWIGSAGGVNYTHPFTAKFNIYRNFPGNANSLSNNLVRNIAEDKTGYIWVATENGLNRFNKATNSFKSFTNKNSKAPQYICWALHPDQNGNIWIGTWGLGLQKFDPVHNSFEVFRYDSTDAGSISGDFIVNITEYHGKLWLSTWGGGICVFDPSTKKARHYKADLKKENALRSNAIIQVFCDSRDDLWIGSANGLYKYRKSSDDFQYIDLDKEGKTAYGNNISCIFEDRDKKLWIGTINGIVRLDPQGGITRLTKEDGLPGNNVTGIVQDDEGNFWISTSQGLGKMSHDMACKGAAGQGQNGTKCDMFKRYLPSDGLPTEGFSGGSYMKDRNGILYFGTIAGLISFKPADLKENAAPPPVYITSVKVLNKPLKADTNAEDLNHIELLFRDKSISFEFAALNYVHPEKNEFAYQLEGFDKDWQYSGDRNFATYTNLEPGEYTFRIRAANNDGIWNNTGAVVTIKVIPPFWKASWFYLLCGVMLITGFIGYTRWRTASLRSQKQMLEITVEKRTKEMQMAKDRAEQSEKFKQQFLANMSHEIRTPMNAVSGMTDLLIGKEPRVDQKDYLHAIRKSSDNLLHIINDILDLSKIEAGKIELENIDFSLRECVDQVHKTLQFKANEKGISLAVDFPEGIHDICLGDPVRLNQILMNLTGNAIKFTPRGIVKISVRNLQHEAGADQDLNHIHFAVEDTGIGIPHDKMDSVFGTFNQAHTTDNRKFGGSGLGLSISKELVELMGGKIEVKSEEGVGTVFSFALALPKGSKERLAQRIMEEEENDGYVLDGLKILLADDNEYNRIVATDTLKSVSRVSIDEAVNGEEVIRLLEKNDYDVILMDVQMPVMSGFTASRHIRDHFTRPKKDIPIIAFTASVLKTDLDKCTEAGMNAYVPKPFKAAHLIATIARVTGKDAERKKKNPPATNTGVTAVKAKSITDLAYLHQFCEGNSLRMKKYIGMFLQTAPGLIEKLEKALSENDAEELAIQIHGYKVKWIMMGMHQTEALAAEIEHQCRETHDSVLLKENVLKLISDIHSGTEELKIQFDELR
jgi:signal transduction histidine kinase/ligand-binding sensor domain-containing protein/HPt (histidine-containing phosphotransfer) domain-containing protein/FixJ family two-component response regulator